MVDMLIRSIQCIKLSFTCSFFDLHDESLHLLAQTCPSY